MQADGRAHRQRQRQDASHAIADSGAHLRFALAALEVGDDGGGEEWKSRIIGHLR